MHAPPPSPPPLPPPLPLGLRGGRRKGGGGRGEEEEGGKWGEGGPGIPPCPSLSKASPAPFLDKAAKFWG
jgi:hypothetical protein